MFEVEILADSISPQGARLTTVEATMPRIILAELNTHRMFSRNSASSRAIPINKKIKHVLNDPFVPEAFGANKAGMSAGKNVDGWKALCARWTWLSAMYFAVLFAWLMSKIGIHKQWANRLLEPFAWQTVIISATDWDNFFALRCHPAAQPEIRKIAEMIKAAMAENKPKRIDYGEWHLPLVFQSDIEEICTNEKYFHIPADQLLIKLSVARCARVSYLTHDGKRDLQADLDLYEKLLSSGHLSPMEHAATPYHDKGFEEWGDFPIYWANFRGWKQHRKSIPNEKNFSLVTK